MGRDDSFENLGGVVPDPEEVLVPPEHGGGGVGLDVGVHAGLPHPRGRLGGAKAERGSLVAFRLRHLLFLRVICNKIQLKV